MASIGSSQRLSAGKSRNSQQDERRDQLPSDAPAFPAGTDKKIRAYVYRGNGRVKAGLCSRQPSGSWWTHSLNWRHAVNFHTGRLLLLSCRGVRASILKRDWPKHHDNTGDSEGKSTAPVQTGTTAATSNTARRLGPYSGHGLRFHPVQSLGGRDSRKERDCTPSDPVPGPALSFYRASLKLAISILLVSFHCSRRRATLTLHHDRQTATVSKSLPTSRRRISKARAVINTAAP